MQKIAIVVIGILGLMGTQARAADMAVKAPLPAPLPVSGQRAPRSQSCLLIGSSGLIGGWAWRARR